MMLTFFFFFFFTLLSSFTFILFFFSFMISHLQGAHCGASVSSIEELEDAM